MVRCHQYNISGLTGFSILKEVFTRNLAAQTPGWTMKYDTIAGKGDEHRGPVENMCAVIFQTCGSAMSYPEPIARLWILQAGWSLVGPGKLSWSFLWSMHRSWSLGVPDTPPAQHENNQEQRKYISCPFSEDERKDMKNHSIHPEVKVRGVGGREGVYASHGLEKS